MTRYQKIKWSCWTSPLELKLKSLLLTTTQKKLVIFYCLHIVSEILGALLSVFTIWLVTGVLVYLAVERLISGNFTIEGEIMLVTSGCAVVANIMWVKQTHLSFKLIFINRINNLSHRSSWPVSLCGCCHEPCILVLFFFNRMAVTLHQSGHGHSHGGLSSHGHSHSPKKEKIKKLASNGVHSNEACINIEQSHADHGLFHFIGTWFKMNTILMLFLFLWRQVRGLSRPTQVCEQLLFMWWEISCKVSVC